MRITENIKETYSIEDFYKALVFAIKAHDGQHDKGGEPYILHPIYVANHVDTIQGKIVALLHDTIEDTYIRLSNIIVDFGDEIANSVNVLTRKNSETYDEYIARIKDSDDGVAIKVKLVDLEHNSDLSRILKPQLKDLFRREKYLRTIDYLKENDE